MCEGGSMTVDELASNPAEEDLYGAMGDYISYLHDNPDLEVADSLGNWSDVAHQTENMQTREIESWVLIGTSVLTDIEEKQDHLTVTRWGQGRANAAIGKWNLNSPKQSSTSNYRCVTGCIPVAIAQMMYHLHHKIGTPAGYYNDFTVSTYIPDNSTSVTISTSHLTGSPSQSYDWALLPLKIDHSIYTDAQYEYVSSMMTHIGYVTNATYTLSGTDVSVNKIKQYFNMIGINCSEPCSLDWGIVHDEIFERQMPVLLGVSCSHGRHRTILDGIYYKLKEVEKRYVWNSVSGPRYKTEIETDALNMACFNWGYESSGMVSASGDTIWYNMYGISWSAGGHIFTEADNMISGFTN